jgi:hypothetical protein
MRRFTKCLIQKSYTRRDSNRKIVKKKEAALCLAISLGKINVWKSRETPHISMRFTVLCVTAIVTGW